MPRFAADKLVGYAEALLQASGLTAARARTVPLCPPGKPGDHRAQCGGDRLRPPASDGPAGLVDLGHRPYLFPDRRAVPPGRGDQLVVELPVPPEPGPPDHAERHSAGGRRGNA